MTRTLPGTMLAGLLLIAIAYSIAIPLGWSDGALGVILIVISCAVTIPHTQHMLREKRRATRPG